MEHYSQNQFRVTPIIFVTPAGTSPNFGGVAQPDFATEFFQQSFEPGTVTTSFQSHDYLAAELCVERTHCCFVLVLELVEPYFSTVSCQITDGLLSCMKVNADIYFLHSASFQSYVKKLFVSLALTNGGAASYHQGQAPNDVRRVAP